MTHDNGLYVVGNLQCEINFHTTLNLFCQNSNTRNELFNQSKVKYPKPNYSSLY